MSWDFFYEIKPSRRTRSFKIHVSRIIGFCILLDLNRGGSEGCPRSLRRPCQRVSLPFERALTRYTHTLLPLGRVRFFVEVLRSIIRNAKHVDETRICEFSRYRSNPQWYRCLTGRVASSTARVYRYSLWYCISVHVNALY